MSVPPNILEWVRLADDDLGAATLLARSGRYPALACYHAQQAAEKYLKAVLTFVNQPVPRTHDLVRLYQLYPQALAPYLLRVGDLLALTAYGTDVRYPGFPAPPTLAEARQAVRFAGRVRRVSRYRLGLR
jgi:HEPN domain-containing protein